MELEAEEDEKRIALINEQSGPNREKERERKILQQMIEGIFK